ncbi:MAG: hypothetical protein LUG16_07880 [Candidatus Gastranaerophilales bacterium]|nr:hypothetical protein [Candidatus Gastranaerophilales bacterium]
MKIPVEGDSIANDSLQFYTRKEMYSFLTELYPSCTEFSVKDTQVIHYPYDVKKKNNKYIKGYWKELWSIDSCGKVTQIPVTFHIGKKETQFYIEKNLILPE